MRIKGLVRVFNQVRAELRDGISPDEAEAFRKRVMAIVGQVEDICRLHGTTTDGLPAPSRAAYRFLHEIDLATLPVAPGGGPGNAASTFRIKNILAIERHLSDKMWEQLPVLLASPRAASQLKNDIERHSSTIEAMCSSSDLTPWALQPPSRRVYCWLKFLADQDNLELHLRGLQRARSALADVEQRASRRFRLLLLHMQALWTKRQDPELLLVRASEGFVGAGDEVWCAIVRAAGSARNLADDQIVHEFAGSDDFSEVLAEIDAFVEAPPDSTRGRAYSLDESFERVNRAYFGGAMARPRLEWNRMLTGTKFGHYRQHRDTVMLSVSLDDARVPSYVVDFVMYHELLHKKHGPLLVDGRRLVHTPAFRADERLFASYEAAQRTLNALGEGGGLAHAAAPKRERPPLT